MRAAGVAEPQQDTPSHVAPAGPHGTAEIAPAMPLFDAAPAMLRTLDVVALGGFAAVMGAAAFEDFRRFTIPNRVIIAGLALWPLHLAATPAPVAAAGGAAGCALAVFVAGALLFSRGYVGGGDVKLLSVAALWAGLPATPALLAITGLLGGLLSLLLLTPFGLQIAAMGRAALDPRGEAAIPFAANSVPYGMAIAGAALIVTLQPFFG